MKEEKRKELYQKALDKWGLGLQTMMVIEEAAELIIEINQFKTSSKNVEHLAEEMADVTIMLEQSVYMLELKLPDPNEICRFIKIYDDSVKYLGYLIKEIVKGHRGKGDTKRLSEIISVIKSILNAFQDLHCLHEKVEYYIYQKLTRLEDMLK